MRVVTTSPVEGVGSGVEVDVADDRGQWLVDHGYATAASGGESASSGPPAKSASKGDWIDYAVAQGADRDEAEAATKDELVEQYA